MNQINENSNNNVVSYNDMANNRSNVNAKNI